jgi:hypothetical protein
VGRPVGDEHGALPAIIRSRPGAIGTVVLYSALVITVLAALVLTLLVGHNSVWLAAVFVFLGIVMQSSWLSLSRVLPPLDAQRRADAPEDGVGYVLAMLKPRDPRRAFRASPPVPLIAAIRLLREEAAPVGASAVVGERDSELRPSGVARGAG